jgi:ABC-type sulfate transport system permease component
METMRRFQLIGARQGKPVLHWPGLIRLFVLMALAMTVVRRGLEWIWHAAEPEHQLESWGSTLQSSFIATLVIIAMMVVFTWKRLGPASIDCGCDDSSRPVAP